MNQKITERLEKQIAFIKKADKEKFIERQTYDYEICGVYDAADLQKKIMEQSLQQENS